MRFPSILNAATMPLQSGMHRVPFHSFLPQSLLLSSACMFNSL